MDDKLKPKPIHLDIPKVDWSGWESPIEIITREVTMQHEEAVEGMIWHSLNEMGINIDKERLIAVIEGDKKSYADGYRKGYEDGISAKTGKWVHGREIWREHIGDAIIGIGYEDWRCSECNTLVKEDAQKILWKYCPWCGAKMEGSEEE